MQAYICDAMYIGWWTVWEAGKPELSGRWEKTESRWDVPMRQSLLHPSDNDQHPKLTHHNVISRKLHLLVSLQNLIFFF